MEGNLLNLIYKRIMKTLVTDVASDGSHMTVSNYHSGDIDDVKINNPYGVSSAPIGNTSAIVLVVNENNVEAISFNHKARPQVSPGELVLYSDNGQKIEMLQDGHIKLTDGHGNSFNLDQIKQIQTDLASLENRVSALE